jgi:hypothetical protein
MLEKSMFAAVCLNFKHVIACQRLVKPQFLYNVPGLMGTNQIVWSVNKYIIHLLSILFIYYIYIYIYLFIYLFNTYI